MEPNNPNFNNNVNSNMNSDYNNVHHLYSRDTREGISERESWPQMFEKLSSDMGRLWQKESLLIRTEMNEKITDVKAASVSLAGGGVMLFIGAISLAATAIIGLNEVLPLWLSALIVTAVLFAVGFIMLTAGKKKLDADKLVPHRSIDALSVIKNTFQERVHEFKKH